MLLRAGRQLGPMILVLLAAPLPTWAQEEPARDRAVGRRSPSPFEPVAGQEGNAALFVGVNRFVEDESLAGLNFAVNDAIAIAHLFVIEIKLVPPEHSVLALSGEPRGQAATEQLAALKSAGVTVDSATKSRIFRHLQRVIALPQREEDLLLVSLSSHGFEEDGVAYVMPADGVRSFLADTAINLTSVEEALAGSKASKRLLLLDACREKPLAGGRGAGAAMSTAFRAALAEAAGQAVLASCDVGQVSFEDADLEHGIFTHYLLEGLRGAATPDAQGLIRLDQVLQYVSHEVENWSKRNGPQVQQPWFKGPQVAREIPLAVDPKASQMVKARIDRLRALAMEDKLSIEQFKEAERLLRGDFAGDIDRQRAQIYARLADGKTDADTATLALGKLTRRRSRPGTLTVAADGSGQYLTVQEAMDAAQAGDTIMVKPGVYREAITFHDGVRLVGTSTTGCRLEPMDGAYAILTAVDCASGSIENLTFDGRGLKFEELNLLGIRVETRDEQVWVSEVNPDGPAAAVGLPVGVRVVSVDGRPIQSDRVILKWLVSLGGRARDVELEVDQQGQRRVYTIHTVRGPLEDAAFPHGVLLLDSALEARACVVRELAGDGIIVRGPRSLVRVRDCSFEKNSFSGIGVANGPQVEVEDCVFERNGRTGLYAYGPGATVTATGNEFRDNRTGISFARGAGGQAVENRCAGHGFAGIAVYNEKTAPVLRKNQCRANTQYGIYYASGAGGSASENVCEENEANGIRVRDKGTAPELKKNVCHANAKSGVYYSDGAAGLAEENTCTENQIAGIAVHSAGSAPTLRSNHCEGNASCGIAFREGGGGTAVGNTCNGNKQYGVAVWDEGSAPVLKANHCKNNDTYGMMFRSGADGVAEQNYCDDNGKSGIRVRDPQTAPRLTGNWVRRNGEFGIAIAYGAGGLFESNSCLANKKSGIGVHLEGTAPTLVKNICSNNEQFGIRFGDGAGGVARENVCQENKSSGIGVYDKGTTPRLSVNRCNKNESWGIYYGSGAKPRIDRNNTATGNKQGQIKK